MKIVNRFDPNIVLFETDNLDFCQVNLQGANFYQANLQGANFYQANLQGADLQGADLQNAALRGVSLEMANLQEANLAGADLYQANLYQANLYQAVLYRTNLYRANLNSASLGVKIPPVNSHQFVSEILWRKAQTNAQKNFAARIRIETEQCWKFFFNLAKEFQVDQWAKGILSQWPEFTEKIERLEQDKPLVK